MNSTQYVKIFVSHDIQNSFQQQYHQVDTSLYYLGLALDSTENLQVTLIFFALGGLKACKNPYILRRYIFLLILSYIYIYFFGFLPDIYI